MTPMGGNHDLAVAMHRGEVTVIVVGKTPDT